MNQKLMILLFFIIIGVFSIWFNINKTGTDILIYPDSHSYLNASVLSFLDKSFYINRPVTITLIYKLAKSDPNIIILIQKILYTFASIILAISTMLLTKANLSKWIGFILVLLFIFWWNIIGWNNVVHSESIAHSFLFLWLSTYIFMIKNKSKTILFIHLIIALLFAFTRDQWLLLMIIFYFINLVFVYKTNKMQINYAGLLLFVTIFAFIGNMYLLKEYKKHSFSIKNVIFQRILVNDNYLNWFIKHGMPYDNNLIKWKGEWAGSFNSEMKKNPEYKIFNTWVDKNGKKTLGLFLVTHPNYFFKTYLKEVGKTLTYNLVYIIKDPPENKLLYITNKTFPLFNLSLLLILSLITIVNIIKINYQFELIFPLVIIVLSIFNGIICFHVDPMEIERHTIANQIFLQYSGIIMFINLISIAVKPEFYRNIKMVKSVK